MSTTSISRRDALGRTGGALVLALGLNLTACKTTGSNTTNGNDTSGGGSGPVQDAGAPESTDAGGEVSVGPQPIRDTPAPAYGMPPQPVPELAPKR